MSSSQWDKEQQFFPLLEYLKEPKDIIFDFDINELESDDEEDNEGEESESGEVENNEGEASQSGEVVDNEGEASQSGEMVDNEGEASESDKDKSSHESGENNDESADMEHVPVDGTMTDFMTVKTRCGMQVTITSRTYNFFKESIHLPERRTRTEYLGIEKLVKTGRNLEVFADGLGEENEGYVSICFQNFDGSCIVSVIDASENQRFSQSYNISLPDDNSCIIDKFISHKRLLSDPDELLPDGTLTLVIHASLKPSYIPYLKMPKIQPNILQNFRETSKGLELLLGSPLAKSLTEESNVFREMLVTPVSENSSESINIPDNEIWNFIYTGKLLMGYNPLVFDSIEQIFDMYLFADKYDMPFAGRTYLLFMDMYACVHGTDDFWGKVDDYVEKEYLKELLKSKISLISESKLSTHIDNEDKFRNYKKQHKFKDFWFFVEPLVPLSSSARWKLLYYNLSKTVIRLPILKNDENDEYDFYK